MALGKINIERPDWLEKALPEEIDIATTLASAYRQGLYDLMQVARREADAIRRGAQQ